MSAQQIKEKYTKEIDALQETGNHHVDIYNSQLIKGYEKQLEGQKVFSRVVGACGGETDTFDIITYRVIHQMDKQGTYTMDAVTADTNLKKYVSSLTDVEYKRVVDTFDLTRSYKKRGDATEWNSRRCTFFIKSVLGTAYGIEYGAETTTKNNVVSNRIFTCNRMIELKEKYQSRLVCDYGYAF
jgi:hypothetical protein